MALTITKATVGSNEDTWGGVTNAALDAIVTEVNNNADGTNATTPNMTSFQVGGVAVTSTAAELNKLDGATVTTAEINILDGNTSATSTTVVDADRVVFNDDGTMKQVALSDIKTYINASAGSGSVTSVGLSVPTGLSVSGSPVTTTGTLAISLASGYSIPTTSSQSNWNTAYGWGDHGSAGYLTSAPAPSSAQVGSATAGLALNAVGTYAWLGQATAGTFVAGTNYSGSGLKYSGFLSTSVYSDDTAASINGSAPSGTWRAMGSADRVSNRAPSTLFLKIAN
jgi:hypothetical protein